MTIDNYKSLTPCEFFEKPPVKRCLIRFIQKYGNFGGMSQVYTQDSVGVTWSGTGTLGDPLSIAIAGGTQDLQSVTDQGNSTTNDINAENSAGGAFTNIRSKSDNSRVGAFSPTETYEASLIVSTAGTKVSELLLYGPLDARNIISRRVNLEITDGTLTPSNIIYTDGRISGAASTNPSEFVIQSQVLLKADYKGGQSPFTADNTTTIFNITHNLGAIPSYFTLTTTEPISPNHLARTITFPDNNTMRITFTSAPLIGEDANYIWVVFR